MALRQLWSGIIASKLYIQKNYALKHVSYLKKITPEKWQFNF